MAAAIPCQTDSLGFELSPDTDGAIRVRCLRPLSTERAGVINLSPEKEGAGLQIEEIRQNPYEFISQRARDASVKYGVTSVSLLARKE
jgi:hypothetical protein